MRTLWRWLSNAHGGNLYSLLAGVVRQPSFDKDLGHCRINIGRRHALYAAVAEQDIEHAFMARSHVRLKVGSKKTLGGDGNHDLVIFQAQYLVGVHGRHEILSLAIDAITRRKTAAASARESYRWRARLEIGRGDFTIGTLQVEREGV